MSGGDLRFLILKSVPADLAQAFEAGAQPMPQARLARGGWRFEGDALAALRARMAAGRQTLAQAYGAPLYGIKTGLNEAFVLTRGRRDALVAADPASAELLKPFLIGENLKRWHVEGDDLWLIYTPKNRVAIDDYPAIRDHLLPFREQLEARATKQGWWELQQAQAAYEAAFLSPKLIYPHFNDKPNFSFDPSFAFSNDKSYIIPNPPAWMTAILNAKAVWQQLVHLAPAVQRGYREARVQYVSLLVLPDPGADAPRLAALAKNAADASIGLWELTKSTHRRLADLHPSVALMSAFAKWPNLNFAQIAHPARAGRVQDRHPGRRARSVGPLSSRQARRCRRARRAHRQCGVPIQRPRLSLVRSVQGRHRPDRSDISGPVLAYADPLLIV